MRKDEVVADAKMVWEVLRSMLPTIIITFLVVALIARFVIQIAVIPSSSMYPTLKNPCISICERTSLLYEEPSRCDIVTFTRSTIDEAQIPEKVYIKRIVGLPGETVEIKEGVTFINGKPIFETYLAETAAKENYGPFVIPDNCYFMMGDNRNHSVDSRVWEEHFVPRENIQARLLTSLSLPKEALNA